MTVFSSAELVTNVVDLAPVALAEIMAMRRPLLDRAVCELNSKVRRGDIVEFIQEQRD